MNGYRYRIVDVFTEVPLEGNALAVFPDCADLGTQQMQKIARELNLSETTFVVPSSRPDCAVGVRIFTPAKEMIFAGHPTIGTSFVLLEEGIVPANSQHFVLDEKVGPVSHPRGAGSAPIHLAAHSTHPRRQILRPDRLCEGARTAGRRLAPCRTPAPQRRQSDGLHWGER
jgi:PhzF family phenazine biosynthesis protein